MRILQKLVKSRNPPNSKSKGSTTNSKAATKSSIGADAGDPGLTTAKTVSFPKGTMAKVVTKSPISASAGDSELTKSSTKTKAVSFSKGPSSNSKTQTANTPAPIDGSSGSSSKSGSSSQTQTISAVSSGQEAMKILTSGKRSKVKDLTGIVDRDEHQYIGGGAFGDVYKGVWKDVEIAGSQKERYPDVVVKVLRSMGKVDAKALARRLRVSQSLPRTTLMVLRNTDMNT
jgi:hypothetical protein